MQFGERSYSDISRQSFHFKKFTLIQDRCSMKVGTDGVLLGAWVDIPQVGTVLDVGTGTGLISLMIAQRRSEIDITAVEIDSEAASQANDNVQQSEWSNRIKVINADFFLSFTSNRKYDLIVTNPPFYVKSCKSTSHERDIARGDTSFSLSAFFSKAVSLLAATAEIAMILPYSRLDESLAYANDNSLFIRRLCCVRPAPNKDFHRVLLQFSNSNGFAQRSNLTIEVNGRHNYSHEYIELTKEFYLRM